MPDGALSNLHRLRTFLEVAEQQSFSRAARRLHLTQPTISSQVRELEEASGDRLFVRGHGKVTLTETGRELYSYAQKMVALSEEMESAIQARSGTLAGRVAIGGAYYVRAERALANLLIDFRIRHPEVTFLVRFGPTHLIAEMVRDERLALGVVSPRPRDSSLAGRLVLESQAELRVVVPVGHPLTDLEVIAPRDLEAFPFVHHPRLQQAYVDEYLADLGCHPRYAMEIESPEGIRDAVALGAGITLLPELSLAVESPGRLVSLPLAAPPLETATHVVWNRDHHLTSAERAVVDSILDAFAQFMQAEAERSQR